jgi:ABC-type glycerol-3-phosphate transport system substrate-binding protein
VNIPGFYHKYNKKSRSFGTDRPLGKWIDIFLVIGLIIVLVFVVVNRVLGKVNSSEIDIITNITISAQFEFFFGKDTVDALIQEFEDKYPDLRIQATGLEDVDIIFFDDSVFDRPEQWTANTIVPLVSFVDLFFYNIDILKAANSDRPPKTRAEFFTTAKAVADKYPPQSLQEPVYAFALGLSPTDTMALRRDFYPWVWADGGELYSSGAGTAALSRTATNTISFLGRLDSEGLLAPQSFEKTGTQRLEEFARGEIAMMITSAQAIAYLRHNARALNFDVSTIPATLPGKSRLGLSGIYAGINSNCSLPDDAGVFLAFIADKSQVLAEAIGAVPGSLSITFPGEYIVKDTLYSKAWDIFESADMVEYYHGQIPEEEIREKLAEVIKR